MATKSSKILKNFVALTCLVVIVLSVTSTVEEHNPNGLPSSTMHAVTTNKEEHTASLRESTDRFLAQQVRDATTCNKSPRVCRASGSAGPYCCNKQCVNVKSDKLNCGKCGNKCKYSEICCKGKCVNTSVDAKHCGRCNNYCSKGNSCAYGLCSYA